MKCGGLLLAGLFMLASASGCAMCCSPYDCAYPACGGRWERTNLNSGRVGSAFEPAGDVVVDGGPTLAPVPTPAGPPVIHHHHGH